MSMEGGASGSAAVTDSAMAEAGAVDPVRLTLKPAYSASFFSRNSIFLSQQFSQNSVFSQFQPSFSKPNGSEETSRDH